MPSSNPEMTPWIADKNRIVVLKEDTYYLEDDRMVDDEAFLSVFNIYKQMKEVK